MTKISFDRSGGVVGRDLHHELELENLPEEEAEYLQKLLDDVDFFNIPENTVERPVADEFQYQIRVDNGSESHTVHTSDSSMPDSLQPLVKELTMQNLLH